MSTFVAGRAGRSRGGAPTIKIPPPQPLKAKLNNRILAVESSTNAALRAVPEEYSNCVGSLVARELLTARSLARNSG